MLLSARPTHGGGGFYSGGAIRPRSLNITVPTSTVTLFSTIPATPFITISSNQTTTVLSVQTATISTTFSTTISTTGPTITVFPKPSSPSNLALLQSNVSLTRTGIIVSVVMGTSILVVLLIALLLYVFGRRRRRREREDLDSPPFTSLAARSPPSGLSRAQSAPQIPPQQFETSLSMGPRLSPSRGYLGQQKELSSHPPSRPAVPLSSAPTHPAPTSQQPPIPAPISVFAGLPAINVQPNTPSVFGRDRTSSFAPISQPSPAARATTFRERAGEEPTERRVRIRDDSNTGYLEPPGGTESSARRASVSTLGSYMGFTQGDVTPEERPNVRGVVVHSTRASSGVFPEP